MGCVSAMCKSGQDSQRRAQPAQPATYIQHRRNFVREWRHNIESRGIARDHCREAATPQQCWQYNRLEHSSNHNQWSGNVRVSTPSHFMLYVAPHACCHLAINRGSPGGMS